VISDLFALAIVVSVIVALVRWRAGIYLMIIVGSLQDPIRKITPDAPAIMAISSLPIWCAMIISSFHSAHSWQAFRQKWPQLARMTVLFLISLLPATLLVFQYGLDAWRMAAIGIFGYLVPVVSLLTGFVYARDPADVRRLVKFYCAFTGVLMTGSFLEYGAAMPDWPAIGTSALNMQWVRYVDTGQVKLIAGFYRSPDIMGWHAAALAMFAVTLRLAGVRGAKLWNTLAIVAVAALLISGRRKMIGMPVLWLAFVMFTYFQARRLSAALRLVAAVAVAAAFLYVAAGEVDVAEGYYVYAASLPREASGRLMQDSFGAVVNTLNQSGPLGRGIGTASQGTQHIGLDAARGWQESGLSKLAVELGLPGLLCALVLFASLARHCMMAMRAPTASPSLAALKVGLLGFVVANSFAFVVSHQVYGDPLVMMLTSFMLGAVLASSTWQESRPAVRPPLPARVALLKS
jgi:O-antigen ligase